MQSIETIAEVNQQGLVTLTLPATISPGKHRIIVVIDDEISQDAVTALDDAPMLMQLAGKIAAFKSIKDPLKWQQQQRDEWEPNEGQ